MNNAEQNTQISVEQMFAAVLTKTGPVTLSLQELMDNYSTKSIAVTQDSETQDVTFTLGEAPVTQGTEEAK